MFYVDVKLKESKIHGIGLFTNQKIPKGVLVYSRNKELDLDISESDLSKLNNNEIKTIKHYGYFDRKNKKWHLSFDNIRFCNHKKHSNLEYRNGKLYAKRDIRDGEELTNNYADFEDMREGLRDD